MSKVATHAALNRLLIELRRSLLQYVGESWPWSDPDAQNAQRKINELVAIQKRQAGELTELLHDAEWSIEKGSYPTEYTDLHYVALSYLLDQIVKNQQALVNDASRALDQCQGDADVSRLASEIHAAQEQILVELKNLAQSANRHDSTKFTNQPNS